MSLLQPYGQSTEIQDRREDGKTAPEGTISQIQRVGDLMRERALSTSASDEHYKRHTEVAVVV